MWTFTFTFRLCLVLKTKFTFTFCGVKVNSAQQNDACDQGLTVKTCCAGKTNIDSKFLFVCLNQGHGK